MLGQLSTYLAPWGYTVDTVSIAGAKIKACLVFPQIYQNKFYSQFMSLSYIVGHLFYGEKKQKIELPLIYLYIPSTEGIQQTQ